MAGSADNSGGGGGGGAKAAGAAKKKESHKLFWCCACQGLILAAIAVPLLMQYFSLHAGQPFAVTTAHNGTEAPSNYHSRYRGGEYKKNRQFFQCAAPPPPPARAHTHTHTRARTPLTWCRRCRCR